MASVNKVIVVGNLGADPEFRSFPDGGAVCNINVATTRRWKAKDSNEFQEETEWHRIVFRGRLAEIAEQYLRKGHPVYVEGHLKTRKWQDKDGVDRYTTEVIAENMQLLNGGRDDDGGSDRGRDRGGRDDDRQRSQGNDRNGRGNGNGGGRDEQRNTRGSGNGGSGSRSNVGYGNGGDGGRGQQPKHGGGYDDMDDDIPY